MLAYLTIAKDLPHGPMGQKACFTSKKATKESFHQPYIFIQALNELVHGSPRMPTTTMLSIAIKMTTRL